MAYKHLLSIAMPSRFFPDLKRKSHEVKNENTCLIESILYTKNMYIFTVENSWMSLMSSSWRLVLVSVIPASMASLSSSLQMNK